MPRWLWNVFSILNVEDLSHPGNSRLIPNDQETLIRYERMRFAVLSGTLEINGTAAPGPNILKNCGCPQPTPRPEPRPGPRPGLAQAWAQAQG